MADLPRHRPLWWSSVRARTTLAATAVVAVALVAAGLVVLAVLRHNLVDSASLQAEMAAHDVATQIAVGTDFRNLKLPDADSQPVQVVSADGRVLAADDDLRGRPPMADFAPPIAGSGEYDDDDDDDDDENGLVPAAGAGATTATFGDVRWSVHDDEPASHDFRIAAVVVTAPDGQPVTVYAGVSLDTAEQAVAKVRRAMLPACPCCLLWWPR